MMENNSSSLSRRKFLRFAGLGGIAFGARKLLGPAVAEASPHSLSTAPTYFPRAAPKLGETVHEFDIELTISIHEILPGVKIHAFTYNGTYPGPEIRVPEGDWVKVNFTNQTAELHTIHWHGIQVPNEMDGVPNGTQWGVGPGQTFQYLFRAQPAGTHFYHCHNMTTLHVQAGMFGALIIESTPRWWKDRWKTCLRKWAPWKR
jgi:FtsP/CotA-like multicopper oxidase with cupredoxin domain